MSGAGKGALVARNTLSNAALAVASRVLGLAMLPVLVAHLGARGYGTYLLAVALAGHLGFLDLGVSGALARAIAARAPGEGDEEVSRLVSTALALHAVLGLALAAVLAAVASWGLGWFRLDGAGASQVRANLLLLAAWTPLTWPLRVFPATLVGLQAYGARNRIQLCQSLLEAAGALGAVVAGAGPEALVVACGSAGLAGGIAQAVAVKRRVRGLCLSPGRARWGTFRRKLAPVSIWLLVEDICSILYYQADRLLLALYCPLEAQTLYEVAAKPHRIVRDASNLTTSAVMPAVAAAQARGDQGFIRQVIFRGCKYNHAVVLPLALGLIVLAPQAITAWMGPEYAAAAPAARLYVSYWLVMSSFGLLGQVLYGLGRLRLPVGLGVAGTAINLAASLVLVRHYGVLGVVAGTVIGSVVGLPVPTRLFFRALGIRLGTYLRRAAAPTFPLALAVSLGLWLAVRHEPPATLAAVAAYLAISLAAFAAIFWPLALDRDEQRTARLWLRQARVALVGA